MTTHKPVLLKETIELLNLKEGDVVVDATLGGGGHSRKILEKIGRDGVLIGIDLDCKAVANFSELPISLPRRQAGNFQPCLPAGRFPNNFQIPIFKFQNQILVNDNFNNLRNILEVVGIEKVNAILADLGWSSDQLKSAEHGMSFQTEAILDMRYDRSQKLTAKKIVNEYSSKELERIISEYGEERLYRNIVKRIIEYRKNYTIKTTTQLADIIKNAVPPKYRYGKIDPATRTFQALRIEVNQELSNLEKFIPAAIDALKKNGRLGIITFHSLEDRIVKNKFRENARGCICPPAMQLQQAQDEYLSIRDDKSRTKLERALRAGPENFPQCMCGKKTEVRLITKKPVLPSKEEIEINPRARSAKLRVAEKTA